MAQSPEGRERTQGPCFVKRVTKCCLLEDSQGNVKMESHFGRETRLGCCRGFLPRLEARPPSLTACSEGLPSCCGHFVCTCPRALVGATAQASKAGEETKSGKGPPFHPDLKEHAFLYFWGGEGHEDVKLP